VESDVRKVSQLSIRQFVIYYQSVMVLCITNFYKKYVLIKLSRCKLANATTDFKNFNPPRVIGGSWCIMSRRTLLLKEPWSDLFWFVRYLPKTNFQISISFWQYLQL